MQQSGSAAREVSAADTKCSVLLSSSSNCSVADILKQMDICSCLSAESMAQMNCVTASLDEVVFGVGLGSHLMSGASSSAHSFVVVEASVNAAWRTSCEVGCVAVQEFSNGERLVLCSAYFTFCNPKKEPFPTLVIDPSCEQEVRQLTEAQERRRIRLARKSMLEKYVEARAETAASRPISHRKSLGTPSASSCAELMELVLPVPCPFFFSFD
jgi:acyl-CoA hydrolase